MKILYFYGKKCYTKKEENKMREKMKTLYEILEVSENASQEIIEKAYRVLAKKYHPDLQPQEKKQDAEQKMKMLNEAYSILSNTIKRKSYDEKLQEQRKQEINFYYENTLNKPEIKKQQHQTTAENQNNKEDIKYKQEEKKAREEKIQKQKKYEQEIQKNMQAQYEQKYQQAYEGYLRSLGYKIKYKWTWENYKDFMITILIIIAIGAFFWFLPPTHNMIVEFYESNPIIKTIADVIGNIFLGFWNAICAIFK